jgi:hypothetical protein
LFYLYYSIHRFVFVTRLIINKINKVQWMDFKLENVLVSLYSLNTMGLGSIIFKEWIVTRTFSYAKWLIEWLVGKAISYRGLNDLNKIKLYKTQVTVCVAQYLLFSVAFGKLLFVFLLFFYRPLSCLSFLELRLLITPMISSNISSSHSDNSSPTIWCRLPIFVLLDVILWK